MITSTDFRDAMAQFASGVTTITWGDVNAPEGITVSAFSSLSLTPPLVLFCINNTAQLLPEMKAQPRLAINILSAGQRELAYQFAGKNRDNLTGHFVAHDSGLPILKEALCTLIVEPEQWVEGGDHLIFIMRVQESLLAADKGALLYFNRQITDHYGAA